MDNYIEELDRIKFEWNSFKADPENKKIRIRDAANQLNVSEAELLSTEVGDNVFYLKIEKYNLFFKDLLDADRLMFLIRSNYVVHEVIVNTSDIDIKDNSFIYIDKDFPIVRFDSQLFRHVFFEQKTHAGKELKSFQIFDLNGNAILKIYLKGKAFSCFDQIADKYKCEYDYAIQKNKSNDFSNGSKKGDVSLVETDYDLTLKFSLNKKIDIKGDMLRYFLEKSSSRKNPIQIHAFGDTVIQYYKGKIKNVVDFGPWINVIDKKFNIHIFESKITSAVVSEYIDAGNFLFVVDFFDIDNNNVLGLCPVENYEDNFNDIVNDYIRSNK